MKKIIYLLCSLQITGCVYKSVIIAPRNDGDATILYNQFSDSTFFQNNNTILNNPISLSKLLRDENREKGSSYFFMSNSEMFIEGKSVGKSEYGEIIIQGTIYNKVQKDTLAFDLKYYSKKIDLSFKRIKRNNYRINFSPTEKQQSDSLIKLSLSKTNNFVIQKDIFELLTGEVSYRNHEPFKYVIINDPDTFSEVLKPVCILTIVDLEQYTIECKKRYKNQCPNGYLAKIYYNFSIFKDINCECKPK